MRTFSIQGRTGEVWQNLESREDDRGAIERLSTLIAEGNYDELRLIQAKMSAITGDTEYTDIVTIRDGSVVDSPLLRARAAKAAKTRSASDTAEPDTPEMASTSVAEPSEEPDRHPQLRFWPTPKPGAAPGGGPVEGGWRACCDHRMIRATGPAQKRHRYDTITTVRTGWR